MKNVLGFIAVILYLLAFFGVGYFYIQLQQSNNEENALLNYTLGIFCAFTLLL